MGMLNPARSLTYERSIIFVIVMHFCYDTHRQFVSAEIWLQFVHLTRM